MSERERMLEFIDEEYFNNNICEELTEIIEHSMCVSKIARAVANEMGLCKDKCYELSLAGLLHDIGKLKLSNYVNGTGENLLHIDTLRYVRMHSKLGYEHLRDLGYSDAILKAILYHHENYDGSGYPFNLQGEEIPLDARIIRVCDTYSALISRRPYRSAFDKETAIELMIEEVKNFDMKVFLAFLTVIQSKELLKALDNMTFNE